MSALTTLGIVHTTVSAVAVLAGVAALWRDKQISTSNRLGQVYAVTTVITCLTALGIFQHGGFGKAHMLALVTLAALALALLAAHTTLLGRASPYVATVSLSATFLFHLIPAVTEAGTRLPLGAPLLASAEAPELKIASGVLFLLFLIGATLQVRRMRAVNRAAPSRP